MATAKKTATQDAGNGARHQTNLTFTKEQELHAFREMMLIRRFEEKAGQLYGMGAIGGFCHLYIGQEAVVVGMQMALEQGDQIITSYRDHGHMLACGMDPKGVMAELTGREAGYSKGKGGSMHMFSKEKNFYGGHGIVGAQVPLGTGLAFANRYRGEVEPMDPVAGHIPGALNRPNGQNLQADGRFKDAAQLREEFTALLDGRDPAAIVHQCGSGITACHNLLSMEIAGLAGSRLYPGSWSEWCSDPSRPVAKGE